jgi:hypothetical protein
MTNAMPMLWNHPFVSPGSPIIEAVEKQQFTDENTLDAKSTTNKERLDNWSLRMVVKEKWILRNQLKW